MPANKLTDRLAKRYLWWLEAPATESETDRLIVQVMDIGDFDDTLELLEFVGQERFRAVLRKALPGQLRPKSWAYWHYRLGLIGVEQEPPDLPARAYH